LTSTHSTIYLDKVKEDVKNIKSNKNKRINNNLNVNSTNCINSDNNRKNYLYKKFSAGFIMPVNTLHDIIDSKAALYYEVNSNKKFN
jgi:hypothetical protein